MQITTTPAPKSTIVVEVEVPAERLTRAVDDATRALSRRTRVAGFRPGKAPRPVLERVLGAGAVLDEAVDRLVQASYRDALIEKEILPLTNADVEIVQAEEGKPLIFKATVPIRPEVQLPPEFTGVMFRWPPPSRATLAVEFVLLSTSPVPQLAAHPLPLYWVPVS